MGLPFILGGLGAAGLAIGTIIVAHAASEPVVRQINRTFVPDALMVTRGTTVRFLNEERIVHHAFVETPGFTIDSGDIAPGASGVLTFDKEGRFAVRCAIHPKMRVDVTVVP